MAPRIYTVAAGTPFLTAVARALLAGDLPAPGGKRPGPLELAEVTLLLPTRRATRALQEAFLRASNGAAVLLPRLKAAGRGLGRPRPDRRREEFAAGAEAGCAARDQQARSPPGPHRAGAAVGRRAARRGRARWRLGRLCRRGCGHPGPGGAARQGAGAADGHAGGGERQPGAPQRAGARGFLRALGAHAGVPAHRHAVLAGASGRAAACLAGRASQPAAARRGGAAAGAAAQGAGDRGRRDRRRSGGAGADRGRARPGERRRRPARARPVARRGQLERSCT